MLRVLGPAAHLTDGLARPLVEVVYQAPTATAAPTRTTRFVHADPLGSPDVLTDAQGQPLEAKSYEAFGAPRNPDWHGGQGPAPSRTSLGFTGHEDDRELGLVNMRGRLYDPRLARFLQPDPLVQAPSFSLSWNPYAYAWHSPLRYTDPSGWQVEGSHGDLNEPRTPGGEGASWAQQLEQYERYDVQLTASGPWANGVEPTGPTPYGAQPQAAPVAPPSQPLWSPGVAGLPINKGVEVDDDDGVSFGAAPGFVEATAGLAGVGAWRLLLSDAALGLMARAPGAFGALNNLVAGALEGVAPGALGGGLAPAYAGAGVGLAAAGERAAGQAEGAAARALGRAGGWLRSFSRGAGPGSLGKADRRLAERALAEFAERHTDEAAQRLIQQWRVKSFERGGGLRDSDPELASRLGRAVSDDAKRYYITYQRPDGGTVQLSVNYDSVWDIFGTIKPSSGKP